jgi:hypothetical protein
MKREPERNFAKVSNRPTYLNVLDRFMTVFGAFLAFKRSQTVEKRSRMSKNVHGTIMQKVKNGERL